MTQLDKFERRIGKEEYGLFSSKCGYCGKKSIGGLLTQGKDVILLIPNPLRKCRRCKRAMCIKCYKGSICTSCFATLNPELQVSCLKNRNSYHKLLYASIFLVNPLLWINIVNWVSKFFKKDLMKSTLTWVFLIIFWISLVFAVSMYFLRKYKYAQWYKLHEREIIA